MKSLFFILFLMLPFKTFPQAVPRPLPVISTDMFAVGQSWVWKYYENDLLYSTEKYTVLESRPGRVLIEMTTKLRGESSFKVHHRLEANPQKCLEAYKNPADKKPWGIRLYYWQQNQWNLVEGLTNTLAFEEKFNCNPHIKNTPAQKTFFRVLTTQFGNVELFQHQKTGHRESSWYFLDAGVPGILAFKDLSESSAKIQYSIHFSKSE